MEVGKFLDFLRELNRRGIKKVQLFITDDLPGIENAIKMVYPSSEWQLCVLHIFEVSKRDKTVYLYD